MAEGAPLLRVYGGNSIEGSNPSLSAIQPFAIQKMHRVARFKAKNGSLVDMIPCNRMAESVYCPALLAKAVIVYSSWPLVTF